MCSSDLMIIHELVSNAIKHAFADGRAGVVRVALHRCNGVHRLSVSDDGDDAAAGIDLDKTLGLRLMESLVRQLHGVLRRAGPPGTRVEIEFPSPKVEPS